MKYEFMDKAADELVEAMAENPGRFSIGVHTLTDCKTGVEYWIAASSRGYITDIWDGSTTHTVFSHEQGERLGLAFIRMQEVKASRAQERILRGAEVENKENINISSPSGFGFAIGAVIVALLVLGVFSALAS